MHYYQFNIGDYTSHTRGLSLLEDLAYRRLLDAYYTSERPFNGCSTDVAREIGMRENVGEVEYILGKFFVQNSKGEWTNKRVEEEIKKFRKKKSAAIAAGRASGKARQNAASEQPLNGRSTDVEPTNNQEPITKNQEPDKSIRAPIGASCFPEEKHAEVNSCPYQQIVDLYHDKLPMLPRIKILNDARKRSIKTRWINELPDLHTWEKYFLDVAKSAFLTGRVDPGPGRRQFLADIDFLIRPSTVVKMSEGKYHRK